jgi:hypothetical protein
MLLFFDAQTQGNVRASSSLMVLSLKKGTMTTTATTPQGVKSMVLQASALLERKHKWAHSAFDVFEAAL